MEVPLGGGEVLTLVQQVGDVRYQASLAALLPTVLAMVVLLGGAMLLARRRFPGQPGRAVAWLLVGLLLAAGFGWLWCSRVTLDGFPLGSPSLQHRAARAFLLFALVDKLAVGLVLVTFVGMGLALLFSARGTRLAAPAAAVVLGLAGVVAGHLWLVDRGLFSSLPTVAVEGPALVHLGQPRDVRLVVAHIVGDWRGEAPEWTWEPRVVHLDPATAPRRHLLRVQGRRGALQLDAEIEVRVAADRADPLLLLEAGNQWDFEATQSCPDDSEHPSRDRRFKFSLRVSDERAPDRHGLHLTRFQRLDGRGQPRGAPYELFGADGETWWLAETDVARRAIERRADGRCFIGVPNRAEGECRDAAPGSGFELAGPVRWRDKVVHNEAERTLTRILTLGLASASATYCDLDVTSVSSRRARPPAPPVVSP